MKFKRTNFTHEFTTFSFYFYVLYICTNYSTWNGATNSVVIVIFIDLLNSQGQFIFIEHFQQLSINIEGKGHLICGLP